MLPAWQPPASVVPDVQRLPSCLPACLPACAMLPTGFHPSCLLGPPLPAAPCSTTRWRSPSSRAAWTPTCWTCSGINTGGGCCLQLTPACTPRRHSTMLIRPPSHPLILSLPPAALLCAVLHFLPACLAPGFLPPPQGQHPELQPAVCHTGAGGGPAVGHWAQARGGGGPGQRQRQGGPLRTARDRRQEERWGLEDARVLLA